MPLPVDPVKAKCLVAFKPSICIDHSYLALLLEPGSTIAHTDYIPLGDCAPIKHPFMVESVVEKNLQAELIGNFATTKSHLRLPF